MAVEPLSLQIGSFAGDAQGQNPWSLSAIYSPSGSINLFINKLGQIRTIDGFIKQNAVAFLTDIGGSAALIRSLYMYRRVVTPVTTVSVLVVGGGGGGAGNAGGGGGGGSVETNTAVSVVGVSSVAVTVGAGGTAGPFPAGTAGGNGGSSIFSTVTALGGGGGGPTAAPSTGLAGGSGGGGGNSAPALGGAASGAHAFAGGVGNTDGNHGTGGGGGASAVGQAGQPLSGGFVVGGAGGAGFASSLSGASTLYGGGGGGAGGNSVAAGGTGGGGGGGFATTPPIAGTVNTGGGGGGGQVTAGAAGGSGIVIVSYPTGQLLATGGTITTVGANTVHTFTANGTFAIQPLAPTALRQLLFVMDDGVDEYELHYSSDLGVTQTFITDFGSSSVGSIMDFASIGDQLFITNGVIVPRMWDGVTLASTVQTQLAAPTLVNIAAGVLDGSFKYRLVPILANKVRKIGSISSASIVVQDRSIQVNWTADADVLVLGYELWRTSGTGLDFYLVVYIDGRLTVTYTDNLPDTTLITRTTLALVASHGDPPPTGAYFCVAHKGRMWWLRTDNFPRRAYWSDPGDPDSVYQDRSFTDCTDAESLGDVLMGGTGEFNGMLVLWMQSCVWTISGTGQIINNTIDWRKRRTNATTGTVHHRATAQVPAGVVYQDQEGNRKITDGAQLVYLTSLFDIRLFDGDTTEIISFQKRDTLQRITPSAAYKSYCYIDQIHGMAVWVIPVDGSLEPNLSVAWNYWYGTWHEWTGTTFGHVAAGVESATVKNVVIAGEARLATGAFLYQLWQGANQAGADIIATLMTKGIYPPLEQSLGLSSPPDMTHEKRLNALFLLFDADASPTTLSVGILPPDALDTDVPTIRRFIAGSSRVRVPTRMQQGDANPGKYFHGFGWRLKISSISQAGPWTLQAIEQLYQVLGGQTR